VLNIFCICSSFHLHAFTRVANEEPTNMEKYKSKAGRIQVESWSNTSRKLVEYKSKAGRMLGDVRESANAVAIVGLYGTSYTSWSSSICPDGLCPSATAANSRFRVSWCRKIEIELFIVRLGPNS